MSTSASLNAATTTAPVHGSLVPRGPLQPIEGPARKSLLRGQNPECVVHQNIGTHTGMEQESAEQ